MLSRLPTKRLILGAVLALATVVQLQMPSSALAATDDQAVAAAQAGVGYLADNQNADGSVTGSSGSTEWATIAVAAAGQDPSDFTNGTGASATDFLATDTPAPTAPATDVERDILAATAAGQDTTNFAGTDYDSTLAGYDNNSQIGDPTLLNDDIFGVIAASATHDPALHDEAQDGLNYFLAHQGTDGGFSYTTDSCAFCGSDSNDTAAAIIAMQAALNMQLANPNLAAGQANALAYLLSTQQVDGGFAYDAFSPSDGSSTAWGLMALNSIGAPVHDQAAAARDWLLANQNPDGGFSYGAFGITASDTYTTAHAVVALLGTTWLLQPAPLDPAPIGGRGAGQVDGDQNVSPNLPVVTLASAISTASAASSSYSPPTQTPATQTSVAVPPSTPVPAQKAPKAKAVTAKSGPHYAVYGLAVLGVIALAWYVLQSRLKQGEA